MPNQVEWWFVALSETEARHSVAELSAMLNLPNVFNNGAHANIIRGSAFCCSARAASKESLQVSPYYRKTEVGE